MSIKLPKWLNWRNSLILGLGLGAVLGIVIALATGQLKAGIGGGKTEVTSVKTTVGGVETTTTTTPQEAKTLWDWLSLVGVPLSLAGLGFWLQLLQQKQTKEQLETERDIAEQNRQEEALQNYYDKVSALLVDKNLLAIAAKVAKAEKDQEAEEAPTESDTGDTTTPEERELLDVSVDVIRARTLATLQRLDSSRKTSLIGFLLESEVIGSLNLSLEGADLEGADLRYAKLKEADLRYANLKEAGLGGANLKGAYLVGAHMEGANLIGANLKRASLYKANLKEANLYIAHLEGANLRYANLEGAGLGGVNLEGAYLGGAHLKGAGLGGAHLEGAYLGGANLKGADLSNANLEKAKLCRTTLPEGINLDPDRDCKELGIDLETELDQTFSRGADSGV